jgi:hypothetical protein
MNPERQIQLAIDHEDAASREATRDVEQAVDRIIDKARGRHDRDDDAIAAVFSALGNTGHSQPCAVPASSHGSEDSSTAAPGTFIQQSNPGSSLSTLQWSSPATTPDWGDGDLWTPLGQLAINTL